MSAAAIGVFVTLLGVDAAAAELTIEVSDPGGAAARVSAPLEVEVDPATAKALHAWSGRVELVELGQAAAKPAHPIWAQWGMRILMPPPPEVTTVWVPVLRFLMPSGPAGQRKFLIKASPQAPPPVMKAATGNAEGCLLSEEGSPVLNYRWQPVAAPTGVDPKYARGDYIHPLYGPSGEVLTDDFPKDHPHHRGVWWSWPVTRWKNEVRDIWAVVGVWSRPKSLMNNTDGPVFGEYRAVNLWKWGDRHSIVGEVVSIQAFQQAGPGRFVDVELELIGHEDGVAIGGRPHGGYGGFAFRAAPTKEQKIVRHVDPPDVKPRRSWLDYSGLFPGGKQVAGVAIFEHPTNPKYPNVLLEYPGINCVMPAFPGEAEVPIPKGKTLTLKHRLWIHPGRADEKALADVWSAYANPPKAKVVKE